MTRDAHGARGGDGNGVHEGGNGGHFAVEAEKVSKVLMEADSERRLTKLRDGI